MRGAINTVKVTNTKAKAKSGNMKALDTVGERGEIRLFVKRRERESHGSHQSGGRGVSPGQGGESPSMKRDRFHLES